MGRKRPHHGNRRRGRTEGPRKKPQQLLTGILELYRPGSATVRTAEGSFTVARGGIHEAMHGDEVEVSLVHRGGSEPMAVVRAVTQRATTSFLGTYAPAGPLGAVRPLDGRMTHDFFVLPEDDSALRLGVGEGDVVEARILVYPARGTAGVITLERRVGAAEELDLLVEAIIASHGLRTEFGPAALAEAAALELDVPGTLARERSRRDLRDLVTLTIDPTDARDFDDAVSAARIEGGGYEVGVHIADVTSYLPWDGPMDVEARQRTCSTYLVDRVIPMLPERLCNDLCSLRPNEDRLAMSVLLTLDARGRVREATPCCSAIRSRARLDYATADALLEGCVAAADLPCAEQDGPLVAEAVAILDEVAGLRRRLRAQRGAIDFETRETKVLLDDEGVPYDVSVRERTRATSLIEEAMLMANEAVAQLLAERELPGAYRVHERPAPEHLVETLPALQGLSLLEPGETDRLVAGDPFVVQALLERARGTAGEVLANTVLLRAQKRAIYLPHNDGHYALGAKAYAHFTSPIRRYPDVVMHRALKALLAGHPASAEQQAVARVLPQLCRTCSEQERVADAAGRESQRVKMAQLFAGRVGERYAGVVVGCERYGLFVTLDDSGAEGLLPTRELGSEWFSYDPARMVLTGEESGRSYTIGQRLAVEVVGATPARGQIDFALAGRR